MTYAERCQLLANAMGHIGFLRGVLSTAAEFPHWPAEDAIIAAIEELDKLRGIVVELSVCDPEAEPTEESVPISPDVQEKPEAIFKERGFAN